MKKRMTTMILVIVLALTGCSKGQNAKTSSDVTKTNETTENNTNSSEDNTTTSDEGISDTIKWFNATYGIITTKNGGDLTLFGGYEANDENATMMKDGLNESWGVTDRKSADKTLQWLTKEGGHNKEVIDAYNQNELTDYTRDELMESLSNDSYSDKDRAYYLGIYDAVDKYGDNAIKAWDLARAMQLSAWYYIAGYYTYEEAMDSSLKIAKELQKTYKSWDDMMQSYLYGFQYWNEDDISDKSSESYARSQIYDELKNQKNSPYTIDWNYELGKEWK